MHDLPGMGYDLKHFVVEWDQQYNEDEQAGKGGVGVVVRKSDVTVRKTSAVARPSFHDDDHPMCAGQSGGIDLRHCHPFLNEICRKIRGRAHQSAEGWLHAGSRQVHSTAV